MNFIIAKLWFRFSENFKKYPLDYPYESSAFLFSLKFHTNVTYWTLHWQHNAVHLCYLKFGLLIRTQKSQLIGDCHLRSGFSTWVYLGVAVPFAITEAGTHVSWQQGGITQTTHQPGWRKWAIFVAACLCSCMAAWHAVQQERHFTGKSGWQVKTLQCWVINYRVDAT